MWLLFLFLFNSILLVKRPTHTVNHKYSDNKAIKDLTTSPYNNNWLVIFRFDANNVFLVLGINWKFDPDIFEEWSCNAIIWWSNDVVSICRSSFPRRRLRMCVPNASATSALKEAAWIRRLRSSQPRVSHHHWVRYERVSDTRSRARIVPQPGVVCDEIFMSMISFVAAG